MGTWRRITSAGARAYWAAGAAALVVVLLLAALPDGPVSHGDLLRALVSTAATALLVVVTTVSLHEGHRYRDITRHLSIRADIAAAGGLGQRLMV